MFSYCCDSITKVEFELTESKNYIEVFINDEFFCVFKIEDFKKFVWKSKYFLKKNSLTKEGKVCTTTKKEQENLSASEISMIRKFLHCMTAADAGLSENTSSTESLFPDIGEK